MLTTRRSVMPFLVLAVIICYGWIVLFNENDLMRSIGSSILSCIGGGISFVWLYHTYRRTTTRQRYSWLLMSFGVLFYIGSNIIWLFSLITRGAGPYPEAASIVWLLAYLIFLIALVIKTQIRSTNMSGGYYIFNIMVFMIIAAAVSVHYLINPILHNTDGDVPITVLSLAYPITNLSILFMITVLYYLSLHIKENKHLKILITGFLLQIVGDTVFIIRAISGTYELGSYVDPLWLLAILVIGIAGGMHRILRLRWKRITGEISKAGKIYFHMLVLFY